MPILSKEQFYTEAEIRWLVRAGDCPTGLIQRRSSLACLIHEDEKHALWLMFNAGAETVDFSLPALLRGIGWYRAADTRRRSHRSLSRRPGTTFGEDPHAYRLSSPRSSAILLVRQSAGNGGK